MATGSDYGLRLLTEAALRRHVEKEIESTMQEITELEEKLVAARVKPMPRGGKTEQSGNPWASTPRSQPRRLPTEVVSEEMDTVPKKLSPIKTDNLAVNNNMDNLAVNNNMNNNTVNQEHFESLANAMSQLALKASLPALDIPKYAGDPCDYQKFMGRFQEMVGSQNLSDTQKMTRLIQFVEGKAKQAISGFDGVPGGYARALDILFRRFGRPHMVTEACVATLVKRPNISSNDTVALCEFADKCRYVLETLVSLNAANEMNTFHLSSLVKKLPIPLQYKWREKAQNLRDFGVNPGLPEVVRFIERAAEAASDPVFGKVGEVNKSVTPSGAPRHNKQQEKVPISTFSTQTLEPEVPGANSKPKPTRKLECFDCRGEHKLVDCKDFKAKTLEERSAVIKANRLCLNCLFRGHFMKDCRNKVRCTVCQGKHATLLHRPRDDRHEPKREDDEPKPRGVESHAVSSFKTGGVRRGCTVGDNPSVTRLGKRRNFYS
jgi:hypothetical protein